MSERLDEQYDVALLGTSLPLSILSAALARAGFSVLHVDDAEHYGGPWASLTLQELVARSSQQHDGEEGGIVDMSIVFSSGGKSAPDELAAVNRHFAISLAPTLLPCSGPTIDVLIRSRVASYCTFRLLQQTAIYSSQGRSNDAWPLRSVPSSKEDIFKDKSLSLVDKRRLMKLLQQALPRPDSISTSTPTSSSLGAAEQNNANGKSFYDHLTSSNGPGFSERLASDVAYGVAMCTSRKDSTADAMQRIQRHIGSVGRYGNSAYLIGQYGGAGEMAQCYSRASAVQGGTFVLSHKVSELKRIQTAEQVNEEGKAINSAAAAANWQVSLEGIDGAAKVGCVVGDVDMLKRVGVERQKTRTGAARESQRQAVGILLLDRGMNLKMASQQGDGAASSSGATPSESQENNDVDTNGQQQPPPETALLVFPPSDDSSDGAYKGAVWALQMGEGTFSCPKGTYLVYLCAALPQSNDRLRTANDARDLLRNARQGVLQLARRSVREWGNSKNVGSSDEDTGAEECEPLFECYMVRNVLDNDKEALEEAMKQDVRKTGLLSVNSSTSNVVTALDEATQQAEDLYWLLNNVEREESEQSDPQDDRNGQQRRRTGVTRTQLEHRRKRQQRAAASAYAVGRGLAGTTEETSEEDNEALQHDSDLSTICDFFPVQSNVDEAD